MRAPNRSCERSVALGEGFPDLVGGIVGLTAGLVGGSLRAARRLAEDAVWMDASRSGASACSRCGPVHYVHVSDRNPCAPRAGCSCCG